MLDHAAPRWNFIRQSDGNWIWQRSRAGTEDWVSDTHPDFGKVFGDAVLHGFVPEREFWAVTQKRWSTHFVPGAAPATIKVAPGDLARERSS